MSNWNPEPWPHWHDPLGPPLADPLEPRIHLSGNNYARARACVDACAGLRVEGIQKLIEAAEQTADFLARLEHGKTGAGETLGVYRDTLQEALTELKLAGINP